MSKVTLADLRHVVGPLGQVKLGWSKEGWSLLATSSGGTVWAGKIAADATGEQLEALFARCLATLGSVDGKVDS